MPRATLRKLIASGAGVFSAILGNVVFFVILARLWTPKEFGQFFFVYSLVTLSALIVDYGYPQRILREAPRQTFRNKIALMRAYRYKAITSIILVILSLIAGYTLDSALPPVMMLAAISASFADFFGSYLRALGRHWNDSINLLVANTALVAAIVTASLAISHELTLMVAAAIYLASRGLHLALSLASATRLMGFRPYKTALKVKGIGKEIAVGHSYAIDVALTRSFGLVDTILLRAFAGEGTVGLYQSGQRLMQGLLPVAQVINNVFLPRISSASRAEVETRLVNYMLLLCFLSGIASLLGFTLAGPKVIAYAFGSDYLPVTEYLWAFGVLCMTRFWAAGLAIAITATGYQSLRTRTNALSLAIAILMIIALCPEYEIWGAIVALTSSNCVLIAIYGYKQYQHRAGAF